MAVAARRGELQRILGVSFGIAVTVGSAIGAGILRAPSLIAQLVPDTGAMLLLWIAGGLVAAAGANVLAELATALPRAGGPYVYVRRALGDVAGAAVLALTGSFKVVFGMIATLNAATFALAIAALFVLRWREPALPRPFRAVLYPWLPGAALVIELALFALFLAGSPEGAAYAAGFWLLCIPLALFARRNLKCLSAGRR